MYQFQVDNVTYKGHTYVFSEVSDFENRDNKEVEIIYFRAYPKMSTLKGWNNWQQIFSFGVTGLIIFYFNVIRMPRIAQKINKELSTRS